MLSESDKNIIIKFAQKYNVSTDYLFGSFFNANARARDIDLGVQGIEPTLFFKIYDELSRHYSKEVDLMDLSHKSFFNEFIEKKGLKIYG